MALSTMQEIFILLEDEKEVPLFRINRWGRAARGVLAKLKTLGWAEKVQINKEPYYKITRKGEEYVDSILSALKNKQSWDKKWRLVLFDIPENKRSTRDKLRRALESLGMGLLQSSVWISSEDIKNEIDEITKKFDLSNTIKYFEVSSNASFDRQIITKSWNIPEITEALEKFIKTAEWALKSIGKGHSDRFEAKKLIFDYALILSKEPNLPAEFIELDDIRKKAQELYFKLRRFVV